MFQSEQKLNEHSIGLFIINNKNEILLHKKLSSETHFLWEAPLLTTYEKLSIIDSVHHYVQQLGISCKLYEVFIHHDHKEHIMIAITQRDGAPLHFATDMYKWMPLTKISQNVIDHPAHYNPWFRTALEGVILYLKNFLNNESMHQELMNVQLR